MRFRPETESNGSWTGFQNVQITDFSDRSKDTRDDGEIKFPWADVYLEVMLAGNSKYPIRLQVAGSYDKDNDGRIRTCSLLNKIYYLFDAIGFGGGPNTIGEWETKTGDKIENIQTFLNNNYVADISDDTKPYYVYVYRTLQKDKKTGEEKEWTRVCPKIVIDTPDNRKELENYVTFMKSRGHIKEVEPNSSGNSATVSTGSSEDTF